MAGNCNPAQRCCHSTTQPEDSIFRPSVGVESYRMSNLGKRFKSAKQLCLIAAALAALHAAEPPLAGTQPLTPNPDFSAAMVAGIDHFLLQRTEQTRAARVAQWPGDAAAHREHLKSIVGAVDKRLPCTTLELVGTTATPALLHESDKVRILRVRWPVLEGVHGEGILIQPKMPPVARIVYIPDADTDPEKLANDAMLSYSNCEIVIPALIDRKTEFSRSVRFGIQTNVPHREWIYRQSFIQGRHIIGFEVQKILSLVDYFAAQKDQVPVLVAGLGEGGLLALYAGALDTRISSVYVWGYFGPREGLWSEPIYRNLFGLLREFGDAEIASLIAPRPLVVHHLGFPNVDGPPKAKPAGAQHRRARPDFQTVGSNPRNPKSSALWPSHPATG